MTINSTAATNSFHGISISATDNSASIANNVFAVYADATLGTNTSANRWAGYFLGRGYFSGNVGIGNNSIGGINAASVRLDVRGTTWFSADAYGQLEIIPTIGNGGETVIRQYTTPPRNGGDLRIRVDAAVQGGNFIIATNANNERMRVTSSGNVLIGTTTDAGFRLDVNGTARVQSNISFGNLASNSFIYAEANGYLTQSMNFQIGGSSNLIGLFRGWGTSGSGTLGGINTASMVNIFSQSGPLMLYANSQNIYFATTTSSLFTLSHSNQNIGIGTTSPNASALLDVSSTTKGFLPPRMTGAQAELIGTPAAGLLVYANNGNGATITSTGWWGYNGTTWVKLN
jgi:hypothetical protein